MLDFTVNAPVQILEVIIEHVDLVSPALPQSAEARASQATLAALARTCRTFHDITLGGLWRRRRGPVSIIKCLPEERRSVDEGGEMVSVRPLDIHGSR